MGKNLFLLLTFTLFFAVTICEAQPDVAASRTGTLSGSQSSGGGQGGGCGYTIIPYSTFLCADSIKTLSINYVFSGNNFLSAVKLKMYSADSVFVDSSFNTQAIFDSATESIMIQKAGTYYFDLDVPGSAWTDDSGYVHPGPAFCHAEWVVTSTVPINIPSQTTFCENGSQLLNAPSGNIGPFQWFYNGDSIQNATSNSFTASKTGNYYVQSNLNSNCVLNSDAINITIYNNLPQSKITGTGTANSTLLLNNSGGDLVPQSVTWYRNGIPIKAVYNIGEVIAGGHGAGNGSNQLNEPFGIFLDSVKNVYIADYNNYRIMKWTMGSSSGTPFVANINQLGGNPTDVLLDSMTSYVSTTNNMLQFSSSFALTKTFNHNAWGLSVDLNHKIYFSNDADEFNSVGGGIYKIDSTGKVAGNNQGGSNLSSLNYPNGVYIDSMFNTYVADNLTDSLNNFYGRILKWPVGATSGQLVAGGNGYGNAPNQIAFAAGITFDKRGNMYVTDPVNNRVQFWKPGSDHGVTITSGFTPWGIKVDDSANVYVADQTNNEVLKFPTLLYNEITADTPGIYKAVITYAGGCSDTSNDFAVNSVLPLKLINFTGILNNNDALLNWQTASEFNTSRFNIQRSLDGTNFSNIGEISAIGNSSFLHNYSYTDQYINDLNTNKIYYRLKETDIDSLVTFSNVIVIDVNNFEWNLKVNPNPVRDILQIKLNNLYGHTQVSFIDITGKKIKVQKLNASGNDVLLFNTNNLSSGVYIIQVVNNEKKSYSKFVKE